MRPIKSNTANLAVRRNWEAPTVTKLPIGAETKSATGHPGVVEPQPPAAPSTKFGFSFEMAFPLSARLEK